MWVRGSKVEGAPDWVRRPDHDYVMEWVDLRKAIPTVYGAAWCGEVQGQNTYRVFDVDDSPEGTENDSARTILDMIERWQLHALRRDLTGYELTRWEEENAPPLDALLWDMCRMGMIPAGRYLVTQWW